jgi:pimeloyl-ACP methyl ester carboxylesterase
VRRQTQIRGAIDAAIAVLDGSITTIESVHTAIARRPFIPLRYVPVVGAVSEVVRSVHDEITSLVYSGARTSVAAAGAVARLATMLPLPSDHEPRSGSAAEMAVAALNGWAGDRLAQDSNPLATRMGLRQGGRHLPAEREALAAAYPDATPRVAIFVHGLACSESMWRLHAERHYGDRQTTYASRLRADFGYTPLYVRYNTGLHVSDNGRQLADLIEGVVSAWPMPVEELILIGHSMGGLVSRSACHYGEEARHAWVRPVRHVVFLGSPHRGAPLEKATNVAAWLLGVSDITRPFAAVLNTRSAGIKDLRYGSVLDEDWKDLDLDALLAGRVGTPRLLEHATHHFVAATITRSRRHPLGVVVGDLLVREPSASGRRRLRHRQFPLRSSVQHFGSMHHLALLNSPEVYLHLRREIESSGGTRPPGALGRAGRVL